MHPRSNPPEVVSAMVGTAGHIDHGKTELVKQLTGFDTDRLPEEKARGMSIDVGFAPYRLSDGRVVGIVDVPGHKEFIRNMVAGAASIDVLVLVIAADDGVMPQTDEHLRIVKVMRLPRIMVALTKIDLVDEELRALARQEIDQFLTRMGFPDVSIVPVSNKTGEGIEELKRVLECLVNGFVEGRTGSPDTRAFRMYVEQTFTVKGHGTVVTGIPTSGSVSLEDRLVVLPANEPTSLRAVQMFKRDAATAYAGACAALNLRDVELSAVARGMAVVAPNVYPATQSLVGSLENISEDDLIKHRRSVKVHLGTAVTPAAVRLLGPSQLRPGESGFALLKLDEPLVATAGDRFLVRELSPPRTVGGGVVLATEALRLRRSSPLLQEALVRAADAARSGDLFGAALLASGRALFDKTELLTLTRCLTDIGESMLAEKVRSHAISDLGGGAWLVEFWLPLLLEQVKTILARHHRSDPRAWGMAPVQTCELCGLGPKNAGGLMTALTGAEQGIIVQHGCLALSSHQPVLSEKLQTLKRAVTDVVTAAGLNVPARGNVTTDLGASEAEVDLVVRLLTDEGVLKPLGTYLCSTAVLKRCREQLLELFELTPEVAINAFRQATGASRRLAVALLEHFDLEGLTQRAGSGRVLASRGEP